MLEKYDLEVYDTELNIVLSSSFLKHLRGKHKFYWVGQRSKKIW
jgi:hypothetical protein